jgi:hypothetical protein
VTRGGVTLAAAGCVAIAVAAVVIVVVAVRDEGGSGAATAGTAPPEAGTTAPEAPPLPAWGDFPGAPPELAPPSGGSVAVEPVPGGSELTVRRADGSMLAVAMLDEASDTYADARFFDRRGRLRVVVSALRLPPAGAAGAASQGARVRCGSSASADAGYRWTGFPIAWRFNPRPLPARVGRGAALAAIRRARAVWNANRSHCRTLPDRSRARFAYRGSTARRTGRDGRSVVEFGETDGLGGVCRGSVACTITWTTGERATESDIRVDRLARGGFFTGSRRRGLDLQSVMVHESGHTLGFSHVLSREVVMFAFIARRSVGGRILGRGDALANNAKY